MKRFYSALHPHQVMIFHDEETKLNLIIQHSSSFVYVPHQLCAATDVMHAYISLPDTMSTQELLEKREAVVNDLSTIFQAKCSLHNDDLLYVRHQNESAFVIQWQYKPPFLPVMSLRDQVKAATTKARYSINLDGDILAKEKDIARERSEDA